MDHDTGFEDDTPSVVKSITQRDLLNAWLRLFARNGQIPRQEEFRPERLNEEMPDLVFLRVEHGPDDLRFFIESDGPRAANAHGGIGKGRYLDEYLGPILGPSAIAIYRQCCRRGRPVYSISTVDDIHGRPVDYERLLLPFSDGAAVSSVIASLKTISESGGFEAQDLMRGRQNPPLYKVRAVIDRNLVHQRPTRPRPGDKIDLD